MTTRLPLDEEGNPIHVLRPTGAAHHFTFNDTAGRNTVAFDPETRVIGVYHHGISFFKLGTDNTVVATTDDHLWPGAGAGKSHQLISIGGDQDPHYNFISFISNTAGSDGTLDVYITEYQ